MPKLIFIVATRNPHKVGEMRSSMEGAAVEIEWLSLDDLPEAPALVEDAETMAENAAKKAAQLANWFAADPARLPQAEARELTLILADDSGLEVDALGGQPGVHSARFARIDTGVPGNATDGENNAKLLRLLGDLTMEKRSARFRCFLALTPVPGQGPVRPEGLKLFEGACEGIIGFGPRGELGFGYDPLFIPDGETRSFGELGPAEKNQRSHRSRAMEKLKAHLKSAHKSAHK